MPFYQPWLTVVSAVLVTVGIIAANTACPYFVPIVLAIISIILSIIMKLSWRGIFLSLLLLAVFSYARIRSAVPGANDISSFLNRTVVIVASVSADSHIGNASASGGRYLQIKVLELIFPPKKNISGSARLLIITPSSDAAYKPGQILQIKGRVCALVGYDEPWLAGLKAMNARQGIFCQIQAYSSDITMCNQRTTEKSFIERAANKISTVICYIRQSVTKDHIQFLGAKAGGLLASMVLGDQAVSLDAQLLEAFRKIGLSHIVAASGFNLTVVTMITYWILHVLCPDKRLVSFVVSINVIIYAALAGLSASIVRAGITCLLVLIAKYFNRRLHGPAALSIGLIINIIIDPDVLIDPGGQLSYAATAGIIFGAETISHIISLGSNNKIVKMFSATLSVVTMAQLAVLPVQLFHFWQIGLLFLPANLLIDPFVTPVTVAGFLASVAGAINFHGFSLGLTICQWLDWLAAIPLQIIIFVTEKLATFDLAVLNTGRPMPAAIVLYYAMLSLWLISLQKQRWRFLATALFVFGLWGLFYQPPLKLPTIIILPHSIICINEQRQAIVLRAISTRADKKNIWHIMVRLRTNTLKIRI